MSKLSTLVKKYWKPRYRLSIELLSSRFEAESDWPVKIADPSQHHFFEMLTDGLKSKQLKLVKQACPCGSTTHDTVIARRDRYALKLNSVLCDACGTVRIDPYFDDLSLDKFYTDIYQGLYVRAIEPAAYFERQLAYGHKIRDSLLGNQPSFGKRVLEVGCGAGGGLSALQHSGFEVYGCDYSSELISYGKSKGVPRLSVGPVDAIAKHQVKFDLVYLHHVFEHVGRPLPTLRSMRELLKPEGRLLIIVPDLGRVHQYYRAKGDPLKFIHVAHKYNYTLKCFEQLGNKTRLRGTLFQPTDTPTAWSDSPELWVEFKPTDKTTSRCIRRDEFEGPAMLKYLLRTERDFLAQAAKKHARSA